MPTKSKAPDKKKSTKKTLTKSNIGKKSVTKKTASKKKVLTKKSTGVRNPAINKKSTSKPPKKSSQRSDPKKNVNDNSVANIKKGIERIKRTTHIPIEEKIETNEPPVEEKSPEINTPDIIASGMEKKSVQRTSIRSYNNNHIPLSSHKKGGIKPFGKKPLW